MAKRERITDFKVQRPIDYDEKAIQKCIDKNGYVLAQVKHDGIRGVLYWDEKRGQHVCVTRENIEILAITERLKEFPRLTPEGIAFDCEVVIPDIPFEQASGLLRRFETVADEYKVILYVFDVLGCARQCSDRINHLIVANANGQTVVGNVSTRTCYTLDQLQEYFVQARSQGYEGVVVKDPSQHYTPNKVQGWWKMKPSETVDGVVTGFVMGEEGKANEGKVVGFKVKLEDNSEARATGFTKQLMYEVTTNPGDYINRYVECTRMEATDKGNSRHLHFTRFRDLEGAEGIKV